MNKDKLHQEIDVIKDLVISTQVEEAYSKLINIISELKDTTEFYNELKLCYTILGKITVDMKGLSSPEGLSEQFFSLNPDQQSDVQVNRLDSLIRDEFETIQGSPLLDNPNLAKMDKIPINERIGFISDVKTNNINENRNIFINNDIKKSTSISQLNSDLFIQNEDKEEEQLPLTSTSIELIDEFVEPDTNKIRVFENELLENLKLSKDIGDNKSSAKNIAKLGRIYRILGDTNKSTEYFKRSLTLYELLGNWINMAYQLTNLGINSILQSDLNNSSKLLEQSSSIHVKYNNLLGVAINTFYESRISKHQNNTELSKEFLQKAINLFERVGSGNNAAICLYYLGNIKLDNNTIDDAFSAFLQASFLFKVNNAIDLQNLLHYRMGSILTDLNIDSLTISLFTENYIIKRSIKESSIVILKE